jgi:hypothetical protein
MFPAHLFWVFLFVFVSTSCYAGDFLVATTLTAVVSSKWQWWCYEGLCSVARLKGSWASDFVEDDGSKGRSFELTYKNICVCFTTAYWRFISSVFVCICEYQLLCGRFLGRNYLNGSCFLEMTVVVWWCFWDGCLSNDFVNSLRVVACNGSTLQIT